VCCDRGLPPRPAAKPVSGRSKRPFSGLGAINLSTSDETTALEPVVGRCICGLVGGLPEGAPRKAAPPGPSSRAAACFNVDALVVGGSQRTGNFGFCHGSGAGPSGAKGGAEMRGNDEAGAEGADGTMETAGAGAASACTAPPNP